MTRISVQPVSVGVDWSKPMGEIADREWKWIRVPVTRGYEVSAAADIPIEPADGWAISQANTNDPILIMYPSDFDERADSTGIALAEVIAWVKANRPELLK